MNTTTAGGRLVFHPFGALAQFEREIIRDRTMAGLAAARARGPQRWPALEADRRTRCGPPDGCMTSGPPRGADRQHVRGQSHIADWSVGCQDPNEAVELAAAEPVAGGEQHPAVHPGRVGGRAATAELLAGDPLPDVGEHLVGRRARWKWSTAILACGSAARRPEA